MLKYAKNVMNKTTHQCTQVYKISVWLLIEILNGFILGGVLLLIQGTHKDTPSCRTLLQIIMQYFESVSQSGC